MFCRFHQSWQNFKDKNPYVNKVLDWKNKYEESDNAVIRASRLLTEKVVDIMGGLFQVSIEICKYVVWCSLFTESILFRKQI